MNLPPSPKAPRPGLGQPTGSPPWGTSAPITRSLGITEVEAGRTQEAARPAAPPRSSPRVAPSPSNLTHEPAELAVTAFVCPAGRGGTDDFRQRFDALLPDRPGVGRVPQIFSATPLSSGFQLTSDSQ
jgi:hypothetical protein